MQLPLSVSTVTFEPSDLIVWVMTIALLELFKVRVRVTIRNAAGRWDLDPQSRTVLMHLFNIIDFMQ